MVPRDVASNICLGAIKYCSPRHLRSYVVSSLECNGTYDVASILLADPTIWDVDETSKHVGEILRIFSGHTSHVFCCAINHPANNILASGSCDETVRLWAGRSLIAGLILAPISAQPVCLIVTDRAAVGRVSAYFAQQFKGLINYHTKTR